MKYRLIWLPAMLGTIITSATYGSDSGSQTALTVELREMAKEFAAIVNKKGGGAVTVGEFSGSSNTKTSAGPGIQLALTNELMKLKVPIDAENFRFEIKGDYQPLNDRESSLLGVKVTGRLIDRDTGEPLLEKPNGRFVFGAQTVPGMLGLNTHLAPTTDPEEMSREFQRALKDPHASIQGSKIRSKAESPFAIELLVKSGGGYVPRNPTSDDKGRPQVEINKNEVYGVRLINGSNHEAAVDLQIDNINCFAFSEETLQYWIVPAGKQVDILGWHKNDQKSLEFKVVDFPETAAAKLNFKPSAQIGQITACFSASWKNDSGRPSDEAEVTGRGTGFGSEIQIKTAKIERTIGQVRDTITIRYQR